MKCVSVTNLPNKASLENLQLVLGLKVFSHCPLFYCYHYMQTQ